MNRNGNVGEYKLPTLEINIQTDITFYEKNAPSLQRIDLKDNTGFNPNYQSMASEVPNSRAVYQKAQVDIGTFNSITQPLVPPVEGVKGDLYSGEVARAQHSFVESLKVFYLQYQVFTQLSEFYDQHAYVFVRFNADELRLIKSCQLQVGLFNYGVAKVLYNAGALKKRDLFQTSTYFPSLVTSPATWAPSFFTTNSSSTGGWLFTNPSRQMVWLGTSITTAQVAAFVASTAWGPAGSTFDVTQLADLSFVQTAQNLTGIAHLNDFLNWQYVIQYTPNQFTTVTNISCDGAANFNMAYATAANPAAADTTLTLTAGSAYSGYPATPFKVLVTSASAQEVMTVTKVTAPATPAGSAVLAVTRANATNLKWTAATAFSCSTAYLPAAAPSSWKCPASQYWSGDGCHCACGAYDPDCCQNPSSTVYYCSQYQVCSYAGTCVNSLVTSLTTSTVSVGCSVGINMPGDVVINGYLGSSSAFASEGAGACYSCMGDSYYGGKAMLSIDSSYYCDSAATGYIRGYENQFAGAMLPALTAASGTRALTVMVDSQPFPTKGFPYYIAVAQGTALAETLTVTAATALNASSSLQTLQVWGNGASGPKNLGSLGWIVSAGTTSATDFIIIPYPKDRVSPMPAALSSRGTDCPSSSRVFPLFSPTTCCAAL